MKSVPYAIAATLALAISLGACTSAARTPAVAEWSGQERRFAVEDFDAIVLASSDDVVVTTGAPGGARADAVATGDPRALATLTLTVSDGVLRIGRTQGSHKDRGAQIRVTAPTLRRVEVAGSGDLEVGPIDIARFEGRVAGSGTLTLAAVRADDVRLDIRGSGDLIARGIEAGAVSLSVAGSGDMTAAGRARQAAIAVAGSGDIDSGSLETRDLTVALRGSGDVSAHARGQAQISASGSGDVAITGGAHCTIAKNAIANVTCN